jgi:hypothetical protein
MTDTTRSERLLNTYLAMAAKRRGTTPRLELRRLLERLALNAVSK